MSPQRLDEILKKYRSSKARCAYLKAQEDMLERYLRMCESHMVDDCVSLSQAITGMPHGSGTSDPTGRLAIDLLSGAASPFVKELIEDLKQCREELEKISREVRVVEIVLEALKEREREVLLLKIVDDNDWGETVRQMNEMHNNSYSKRSLQRLLDRAIEKAYEIVR